MSSSHPVLTRRHFMACTSAFVAARFYTAFAAEHSQIDPQPYFATANRALEALAQLGSPVSASDARELAALTKQSNSAAIESAEKILDRYTLAHVITTAEGYAHTAAGRAQRTLIEHGWSVFLVRISNPIGSTDKLKVLGPIRPTTEPQGWKSTGASRVEYPDPWNAANYVARAWLTAQLYEGAPMTSALSGFSIEYDVIQLYSRDRGVREQRFDFFTSNHPLAELAAKTQYRRGVTLDFDCLPSRDVTLRVRDVDGRSCVASLTIRDKLGRVYPLQAMRLAPDMFFQAHIYRADGETVRLPDGEYTVESIRGPEYERGLQTVVVGTGNAENQIEVQLKRWIDPAKWGWYSGDPHIHASGCAHYERPTQGVSPETVIRHVRGEALSIGGVLSWGSGWYYQKQFFTGGAISPQATLEHPELQIANNVSLRPHPTSKDTESLLRYDVEVSGFPSSHCGHLVLLRLKEQDYPGTKTIQDWPSWNLPILKWASSQGAITGYAHSGVGMVVDSTELPNYEIPPMDGGGTQEAIIDVTHGVVDFLSGCDGQPAAELNAWYHLLNCDFRLAMVGETDYPCVTGERPGVGRSYVRLDDRPIDDIGYDAWVSGLRQGRLYCGDGRSHFLDFRVNDSRGGEDDLRLAAAGQVGIEALVAARLDPKVPHDIEDIKHAFVNGWHLENARIGTTRTVPVELIVNGLAVEHAILLADGTPRTIKFKAFISHSSWIALRILPSAHTHPVFIQVGGKPIRASKKSARWCRICVDKIWDVKARFMRDGERPAAAAAFEHARKTYDRIIEECLVD